MKLIRTHKYTSLVVLLLLLVVFVPSVFAADPSGVTAQNRLNESRMKLCQTRENMITQRVTHLKDMVSAMASKLDSIVQKIETYYTTKVVPTGKTVPNFDALVADIQTNKAAAQTAMSTAENDFTGFSCNAADPKGSLTQFRTDMQNVRKALQDYRTSIKNLVAAIKAVKPTGKPNPSVIASPAQ